MLAYVFWHRPRQGIDHATYKDAQRTFHSSLETPSASFRLAELPFGDGENGYEDWYLVENWEGLGDLNRAAVDSMRRPGHDLAASQSADGWGAVYSPVRGPASIPDGANWLHKPRGKSSEGFISSLPETAVWQRQMVLGPGPEFCAAAPASDGRRRIWPSDP
jgi:hypothetical protein